MDLGSPMVSAACLLVRLSACAANSSLRIGCFIYSPSVSPWLPAWLLLGHSLTKYSVLTSSCSSLLLLMSTESSLLSLVFSFPWFEPYISSGACFLMLARWTTSRSNSSSHNRLLPPSLRRRLRLGTISRPSSR